MWVCRGGMDSLPLVQARVEGLQKDHHGKKKNISKNADTFETAAGEKQGLRGIMEFERIRIIFKH